MANLLTCLRILASLALLFFPPFSVPFTALYLTAGISDMADGAAARWTGTVSESGAKLDTAADLIFVTVCLFKLLPAVRMPAWLTAAVGLIALIKVGGIVWGVIVRKRFPSLHTRMNKAVGVLLFLLPLTLPAVDLSLTAPPVCAAAAVAAIEEGCLIIKGGDPPL